MSARSLTEQLSALLQSRKQKSTYRQLTLPTSSLVDFSSNDFLSISSSHTLRTSYLRELQSYPDLRLSSSSSRLLDGNSVYAEALEARIAEFHGAEKGLLFNSGFDANAGFWSCVPQSGDVILYDEFVHASVHDGMRLSRAEFCIPFSHNSVSDLEAKLITLRERDEAIRMGKKNVFVSVESLYSMDGDVAPLREFVKVVENALGRKGHVVVDEAHSTGIYGEHGRGFVSDLSLQGSIFARLITFGKAVGASGGTLQTFVCYHSEIILTRIKPLFSATISRDNI
jgi:8-amino-7-oxononanoate synthase